MYLGHWSLESPPLDNLPDSRFLFSTAQHDRALAAINYAAHEAAEPVGLSGPPGCGKTLLLRALRRSLPREGYQVAFVPNVACSQVGLLNRVAYHLGGERHCSQSSGTPPGGAAQAMDVILRCVAEAEADARSVVLMLDDWPAQSPVRMLDQLRWLLDLDLERSRICVLLAGERLALQDWPAALAQRVSTLLEVGPMQSGSVAAYLSHRMGVAGAARTDVFSPDAVERIADWSRCVPRLINRVAHLALHVAYVDLADRVDADAIERAIEQLAEHAPRQSPHLTESIA